MDGIQVKSPLLFIGKEFLEEEVKRYTKGSMNKEVAMMLIEMWTDFA